MALYLTHPQVRVDPDVPVLLWGLSEEGRARAEAAAGRPWARALARIVTSGEVKARETAAILAAGRLTLEVWPDLHENDRSATGYLPGPAFEAAADAFFASPDGSFRGWETARAAQARVVRAVRATLDAPGHGPVLLVGHGAVGTLLRLALRGEPIDRRGDQRAGGGQMFAFGSDWASPFSNLLSLRSDSGSRPSLGAPFNHLHFSFCACHPCPKAMPIFSVSFQF